MSDVKIPPLPFLGKYARSRYTATDPQKEQLVNETLQKIAAGSGWLSGIGNFFSGTPKQTAPTPAQPAAPKPAAAPKPPTSARSTTLGQEITQAQPKAVPQPSWGLGKMIGDWMGGGIDSARAQATAPKPPATPAPKKR